MYTILKRKDDIWWHSTSEDNVGFTMASSWDLVCCLAAEYIVVYLGVPINGIALAAFSTERGKVVATWFAAPVRMQRASYRPQLLAAENEDERLLEASHLERWNKLSRGKQPKSDSR